MRIIRGILILILATAFTAGCFWIIDNYPNIFHASNTVNSTTVDVASDLTERIYGLESGVSSDELENYETDVNKEVSAYVHAHSTSSSGGGGSYYYDDDDGYYYSSGGWDGWIDIDDTPYNICFDCGTEYTGDGGCPNPNCPSYNP